jgi:hypothetical protein
MEPDEQTDDTGAEGAGGSPAPNLGSQDHIRSGAPIVIEEEGSPSGNRAARALTNFVVVIFLISAFFLYAHLRERNDVSMNWSGYIVNAHGAQAFTGVGGSWIQPTVNCRAGHPSAAAVWVGIGGAANEHSPIEQIGTDTECGINGEEAYYSWLELFPGPLEPLELIVHPGDRISASVSYHDHLVKLTIMNLDTNKRSMITRSLPDPKLSSAEWIVEAPALCTKIEKCGTLGLADFGNAIFTNATATTAQHTGSIKDSSWSSSPIKMEQDPSNTHSPEGGSPALANASPSSRVAPNGAFTVQWEGQ